MDKTAIFEEQRRLLEGIAYRMLGTLCDAQDVVQDTYLRWNGADLSEIQNPRSWLVTVCTRLAMDAMKSARVRRESYYGPWLPEPLVDVRSADPADRAEIDETVSVALMVALEKLSAAERAAFLLHDVFAFDFEEIASILDKSEPACRKLASRARAAVWAEKPRFQPSAREHRELTGAFLRAAYAGELDQLRSMLAEAVEMHSDGGGLVEAAPEVLCGADVVSQFLVRVLHHRPAPSPKTVPCWFNGGPGVLIYEGGTLVTAISVGVEDGQIRRIYAIRNPRKLGAFERAMG